MLNKSLNDSKKKILNSYNKNSSGFTLVEIIVVILILSIVVSVVIPYSGNMINRHNDRKKIMKVVVAISELKNNTLNELKYGEVYSEGNNLIFVICGKVIKKIKFENSAEVEKKITFNKNGISNGGEIIVHLSRSYKLTVEKIKGKVSVQRL